MNGPTYSGYATERQYEEDWPTSPTSPTNNMIATSSSPTHVHRPRSKLDVSLADMARRSIMRSIHLFDTFGETPFSLLKPILEQCQAKKLLALEEASPHLLQSTGYVWKRLCIKDFKDISQSCQRGAFSEATDWRALHIKRQSEQQEVIGAAAARVKERYASLEASRIAHRVQVVSPTSQTALRGMNHKIGIKPKSANLTSGQKLLRDARKQGNVRSQLIQGSRKSTSQIPSTTSIHRPIDHISKKPRIELENPPGKTLQTRHNGILITRIPGTTRRY